jgi:predicted trehalose synthase
MNGLPLLGGSDELVSLLGPFLARLAYVQSVLGDFGASSIPLEVVEYEVLLGGPTGLASVVVDAGAGGSACRLHVVVGWRPLSRAASILDRPDAVIGTSPNGDGDLLVYDALADRELCVELLSAASKGRERASRVRVVQSLVSHYSLVFDDRLFMKCYRVIEPRHRPEIEMLMRLDSVGFNHLLAPVAHWSRSGEDLGLVREFMPSAVEGRDLALTSLRDLLGRGAAFDRPAEFEEIGHAGGDLADEMRRLGATTAELHAALAAAYGSEPLETEPGGASIRIHGDYHLRRVMRVDAGWLVAGFGDDPLIGAEAGSTSQSEGRVASPLEDLAKFWVSLHQIAEEAVALEPPAIREHARVLASGWVRHNRAAFLRGYLGSDGVRRLLPPGVDAMEAYLADRVPALLAATRKRTDQDQ